MKKQLVVACLVVIVLLSGDRVERAQVNLLDNGGLDRDSDGVPDGWRVTKVGSDGTWNAYVRSAEWYDGLREAGRLGIDNVWLQLGAESEAAIERAHALGRNIISGCPCALVVLGFHE